MAWPPAPAQPASTTPGPSIGRPVRFEHAQSRTRSSSRSCTDARLAAASSELWRIHDSRNLRNLGRRSAAGELFPVLRRAARGADVEIILG